MGKCKVCDSSNLISLYKVDGLPLFQNKVFDTYELAIQQKQVTVDLTQCQECGFVFNNIFDNDLMNYDQDYNNEQNYSDFFIRHLNDVADFLLEQGFADKKIIEIGCGKGFFTELLESKGFSSIKGFDPAYEGSNPNIIKDYYSDKYKHLDADLIILRHVLEHIEKPFEFLKTIKHSASSKTKILIEVPDFDWIVKNKAFWDIFYEHSNYFDSDYLKNFFESSITKNVFGGQYLLCLADLETLKQPKSSTLYSANIFKNSLNKIQSFLSSNKNLVIWGGGK